jgi:hypothetical protein
MVVIGEGEINTTVCVILINIQFNLIRSDPS